MPSDVFFSDGKPGDRTDFPSLLTVKPRFKRLFYSVMVPIDRHNLLFLLLWKNDRLFVNDSLPWRRGVVLEVRAKLVFLTVALILVSVFMLRDDAAAESGLSDLPPYIAVNDSGISFADAFPETRDGILFVPVRKMADAMKLSIEVEGEEVRLSGRGKSVSLFVKKNVAVEPDGRETELWLFARDGRLLVPLEFLTAYFEYQMKTYPELPAIRLSDREAALDDDAFLRQAKAETGRGAGENKLPLYLTFDDGPTSHTMELLDVLEAHGAKATFFVLGPAVAKYPEAVERMVEEGHRVGLHGMTHDRKRFYERPQASLDEMNEANERLKKAANVTSSLIRVPYGSKPYFTKDYRDATAAAGYRLWDWNLDTVDWKYKGDTDGLLKKIKEDVRELKRQGTAPVVLLHDRKTTISALPRILEALEAEGYAFLRIEDSMEPLNFWQDHR